MSQFPEIFTSSGEDGSALTNTTTATSLIPAARKIILPVPYFDQVGQDLKIRASGRISTAASSPGTFTFDVRFGSTVVFNGGASPALATSQTNATWVLEISLKCRVIGASATVLGTGVLVSAALGATTPIMLLPATAPAAGNTFDATSPQTLDLFGTWSAANASNSITCHQFEVIGVA